ncbi:hypothetical protein D3C73_1576930 [compost metagenome]
MRSIMNSGIGLQQMKSRIFLIKGSLELQSHIGSGVHIQIKVPVDREGLIA